MQRVFTIFSVALVLAAGITAAQDEKPHHQHYEKSEHHDEPGPEGQLAPRLQNLGKHVFPVTTGSPEAQRFIDQGLNLAYGFNHAEAARAFKEAARLDPECAMAYWGQALVLGPNINAPMDPASERPAWELSQKALELAPHASPREQAYIRALTARYTDAPEPDRAALDRAYSDAMRSLHQADPDDLDAATLFAESLMDLRPWNYWTGDGQPYPETQEVIRVLESVIERNPEHPGALHLWIHTMEPVYPERAEEAADRLAPLMPGAGHMVHMPSHVYIRLGRYADASRANELAIAADEDYLSQCRAQGIYPLGYYPHNIHFLWAAATFEGRSRTALEAARKTAAQIPAEAVEELPLLEGFLVIPYYAMARFGKWDEVLSEPRPQRESPFLLGVWHHARGLAQVAKARLLEAERELEALRTVAADPAVEEAALWSGNSLATLLEIASEVLAAEIEARRGDYDRAVARLDRAVRLEDSMTYTEPADWHHPVRQVLGAVLLEAGRAVEAEVVYWEDLRRNPVNGWSLSGLVQSLEVQGKTEQASQVRRRFEKAWAQADVQLNGSRIL